MKIETKYNIGDHIWVVYENRGEVSVYDTHIEEIGYSDKLYYYTKECNDYSEDEIILYDEKDKLLQKIEELMNKINEREETNE